MPDATAQPAVFNGDFSIDLAVHIARYCRDNMAEKTGPPAVKSAIPSAISRQYIVKIIGLNYIDVRAVICWINAYTIDMLTVPSFDNNKPRVARLAGLLNAAELLEVPVLIDKLRNSIIQRCQVLLPSKEVCAVLQDHGKDTFVLNAVTCTGCGQGSPQER
jgi:hypothetical protein